MDLLDAAARGLLTNFKSLSNPRLVKRRTKQFLPRKGNERINLHHDWCVEISK